MTVWMLFCSQNGNELVDVVVVDLDDIVVAPNALETLLYAFHALETCIAHLP